MFLTNKGRYAIMLVADIALHNNQLPSLREICNRQCLPVAYGEQICAKLAKAGIIRSFKGPGGGYRLVNSPTEISIIQVLLAVDEVIKMTKCVRNAGGCLKANTKCVVHNLLRGLECTVLDHLSSHTINDLIERNASKPESASSTFPAPLMVD